MKTIMGVLVVLVGVCGGMASAHEDAGSRCRITVAHCSEAEVGAFCGGGSDGSNGDDGRSVSTTTTTVDTESPTTTTLDPSSACGSAAGAFSYHCEVDNGFKGSKCTIQRSDGSVERCHRYVTKRGMQGTEKKFKFCSFVVS